MKAAIIIAIFALCVGFYGEHYVLATLLLLAAFLSAAQDDHLDPEDPGNCWKCGAKRVFVGYDGKVECLTCDRPKRPGC